MLLKQCNKNLKLKEEIQICSNESLYNAKSTGRWYLWNRCPRSAEGYRGKGGHQTNEKEVLFVGRSHELAGS